MKRLKTTVEFLKIAKQRKQLPGAWKRWHWLEELVKGHDLRLGAEIGVKAGRNLFYLLDTCPRLVMYGIDLWEPQPNNPGPQNYVNWHLEKAYDQVLRDSKAYGDRVIIWKGWSHEVASQLDDGIFDFVFIDADHRYEQVKNDILSWKGKVKPKGFLCGHDTHFPGVHSALLELYPDYIEVGTDHCWYVRMPGDESRERAIDSA